MPSRPHLHALQFGSAVREACLAQPYTRERFSRDLMAGISVGIIAIPLAMALAIASGVPPQHGLYTAMIAGFVIALTGGSRYSISGPTAAFVVILFPVTEQFGLGGLLVATLMAGLIMLGLAVARLGRLIEYIPESVTLGFTSGIAIVIATLQIRDFFGLNLAQMPDSYLAKLQLLIGSLPDLDWASTFVAAATLLVLILWPRLRLRVPGHLPAVLVGTFLALFLSGQGYFVETIGTRFSYLMPDGSIGQGIPPFFPQFDWPWNQPGADGLPIEWSWQMMEALIPAAFSIAMLGAIESLLCAVVLDGMSGRRHQANGELMGQGIGNVVVSFLGGVTATAAIARSAANFRAGAESPVSGMVHAGVVMAGLLLLAPWLAHLPMASMAALLVMVAWNMSEAHKVVELLRRAPRGDILVLLVCLSLTVLFDMVLAIGTGIVLASLLFMRDISQMTKVRDISAQKKHVPDPLPAGWRVLKIDGPLFFAAADRVFSEVGAQLNQQRGVILYMDGVPLLDAGGLSALTRFSRRCAEQGVMLVVADLQFQPLRTLARAGLQPVDKELVFTATLGDALWIVSADAVLAKTRLCSVNDTGNG